jgi:DNA polymerase III subunit delta'
MQFSKILGQTTIKSKLSNGVKDGRIAHALLFSGPNGFGKLALAIAYAQYVSCTNRAEEDSCGECPSCRKYEKLIHPDLHFVFPVINLPKFDKAISDNFIASWRETINQSPYISLNSWLNIIGAENKQGSISKFESAEILRKLSFKTFESEYKVMIIWLPEKMNLVASNKLLKILEEPPDKTLFLLVSESQESLLKTILSRTQIIAVPRIDDEAIEQALESELKVESDKAIAIAKIADGSFFNARNLIDTSDEHLFNFENFTRIMRLSYKKDVLEINNWVDEIASIGREKQKSFLENSLRLVRESFMLNKNQNKLARLHGDELLFCDKFSPFINERNIAAINEELNTAHYHIERNGYARLVFFDFALKLIQLLKL